MVSSAIAPLVRPNGPYLRAVVLVLPAVQEHLVDLIASLAEEPVSAHGESFLSENKLTFLEGPTRKSGKTHLVRWKGVLKRDF